MQLPSSFRKSMLIIISSELYLLRADSPSPWGFMVGMCYWGGDQGVQKGNKGKRF